MSLECKKGDINIMNKIKIIIIPVIASFIILFTPIIAFAATTPGGNDVQAYIDEYGIEKIKDYIHINYNGISEEININNEVRYIDYEAYNIIDKHIEDEKKKNDDRENVISQIRDINDGINLKPDTTSAMKSISGFVPAINFFLGLVVSIISAGMTILTACDICYIVFPIIRGKCENLKQEGRGIDRNRSVKAGDTRLKFISDEAEYAVCTSETAQTGKNPLTIYFKKRAAALIILAVVIFILLTGNITMITNIAIKAVSGILQIIQDIAS